MSQENVDIFLAANHPYNAGDLDTVLTFYAADIAWWDRKDDPGATVHRGHDGIREWLAELAEDIADLRVEVKEYIDDDDYVICQVRVTGRGRTSDAFFEEDEVHAVKVRDGKITEVREYHDHAEALKAVGLVE